MTAGADGWPLATPVREWLAAPDFSPLRHAAYHLVYEHDPTQWGITDDEAAEFLLQYYRDGLSSRLLGESVPSPYVLGHDLQQLFQRTWPTGLHRCRQIRELLA